MKTGWEVKPLKDIAVVSTGPFGSLLHKKDYVFGGAPVINPKHLKDGVIVPSHSVTISQATLERLASYQLQVDDLLVGRRGEIGRAALVRPENDGWLCGTGCFFVRPSEGLYSKFLGYLISSSEWCDKLLSLSTGATMKNLSNSALSSLPIPLPPLEEQKRIVAVLDGAFDALTRAHTEANLLNARELFESGLSEIVTNALSNWKNVALSEITKSISDGDHSAPPKSSEGIPFITISNVNKQTWKIDFSNTFKVPENYFNTLKENRKPQKGDVLYTVTGSFGIPVLVGDNRKFCFQRHIGLVRPNRNLDSRWLFYILKSQNIYRQADEGASGTAQRTVSLKLLRGFIVPEVPHSKQLEFADRLDNILEETNLLQAHYQQKLADLDDLPQSLLQKAFAGELT